jgi:STE24 endopeptidase
MPLPLLFAMVLAFGFDALRGSGPMSSGEVPGRVAWLVGGLLLLTALAAGLGRWVAWRVDRRGATKGVRRVFFWGSAALDAIALVAYAGLIHRLDWPRVVEWGFGMRGAVVIDEALILLPFLVAQLATWWGVYDAERALWSARSKGTLPPRWRWVVLRARQSMGIVLPVALVYAAAHDLIRRVRPEATWEPWLEVAGMALMAALVLAFSPALTRLSCPSRSLEDGPLRDRLERLARRFGFRCTDIRVQDTGGAVVNAGVTGAFPWFRYVLLTDALVDCLDDREVEAVFGHEVGHIAHRHLAYFGLFLLGSLGVIALVAQGIEWLAPTPPGPAGESWVMTALKGGAAMSFLGVYFLGLFGFLSRRFERQADVFGCRAVSCDRPDCPPHADLNGHAHPVAVAGPGALCPVGIQTFVSVLNRVEELNGHKEGPLTGLLAWRHGRVTQRVAFLTGLEGRPEAERRFQARVRWLRVAIAVALASALAAAVATDSLRHLGG